MPLRLSLAEREPHVPHPMRPMRHYLAARPLSYGFDQVYAARPQATTISIRSASLHSAFIPTDPVHAAFTCLASSHTVALRLVWRRRGPQTGPPMFHVKQAERPGPVATQ